MSTENIVSFGPYTADIETYAKTVAEQSVGTEFMEGTVIAKPGPKTLRVCYSRGLENCYACVYSRWAKNKNCGAPATSPERNI